MRTQYCTKAGPRSLASHMNICEELFAHRQRALHQISFDASNLDCKYIYPTNLAPNGIPLNQSEKCRITTAMWYIEVQVSEFDCSPIMPRGVYALKQNLNSIIYYCAELGLFSAGVDLCG